MLWGRGLVDGPAWWGLAVLVVLAMIGVAAGRKGRFTLATAAMLIAVLAPGGVVVVATVAISQLLVPRYLGVALTLVGLAVWVSFAWTAVEMVLAVAVNAGVVKTDADSRTIVTWAGWPAAWLLARLLVQLVAVGLG